MDAPLPLILALDISKTCTGVAEGRVGSIPRAYSIRGADEDPITAMTNLGLWLFDRIKTDRPDWIFYEAPLNTGGSPPRIDWENREWHSTRDPMTTIVLAKMTGVVEFIAKARAVSFRSVNVKTARVNFVGAGNLNGPEAKRRVRDMCRLLEWPAKNNDESDALCVWHQGCLVVKPKAAAIITPMMMQRCATTVGGVDFSDIFTGEEKAFKPKPKGVRVSGNGWGKFR